MKIIFLDIDGVIAIKPNDINKRGGTWKISLAKQIILKQILDYTNASIVLSSSWRQVDLELTKKYMLEEGFDFTDKIIDITPNLEYLMSPIKSQRFSPLRGTEINQWLFYTKLDIEQYVILDDDCDMLIGQRNNFIHTDTFRGLSLKDMFKAISILNN